MSEVDQHNYQLFMDVLKTARPDIYGFMMMYDNMPMNLKALYAVMKHVNKIYNGTKYGTVTLNIENGNVTFIKGEEADRIQERAIVPLGHIAK